MNHAEVAKAAFKQRFNCAQSVLSTYAEELGLEREQALRIATGFGGGMGRLADTCGVVTGAFMVLGLKYGMIDPADQASKEKTYAAVQAFAKEFKARFGSLDCRDLLGVDLSTPGGLAMAHERKLIDQRCPILLQAAAEILDSML